ncbi:hypothetical protein BG000_000202, partial [Podila horticola]
MEADVDINSYNHSKSSSSSSGSDADEDTPVTTTRKRKKCYQARPRKEKQKFNPSSRFVRDLTAEPSDTSGGLTITSSEPTSGTSLTIEPVEQGEAAVGTIQLDGLSEKATKSVSPVRVINKVLKSTRMLGPLHVGTLRKRLNLSLAHNLGHDDNEIRHIANGSLTSIVTKVIDNMVSIGQDAMRSAQQLVAHHISTTFQHHPSLSESDIN